jgi:hypothetical protein
MIHLPRKLDARDEAAKWFIANGKIIVCLDGIEQQHVQSYDIDAGEIVRCAKNERGEHFTIDGNIIATETVKGEVTVRYDPLT